LNWFLRIFVMLMAGFMLLLVLLLSLAGLAFSLLRWLFTGQKPQIAVIFQAYRQWQQQAAKQMYRRSPAKDVIEAEVRELPPEEPIKPYIEDKR
jgi:hypothetical protein